MMVRKTRASQAAGKRGRKSLDLENEESGDEVAALTASATIAKNGDTATCTLTEDASDDEDSAPEDVLFTASKESAKRAAQDALAQISKQKAQQKSKRRKQDEKYKEQKLKKQEAIMANRLPEEVLQGLDSVQTAPSLGKAAASLSAVGSATLGTGARLVKDSSDPHLATADDGDRADNEEQDEAASVEDGFIAIKRPSMPARYKVNLVKDVKAVRDMTALQFKERFQCGFKVQREAFSVQMKKLEKRKARVI